MKKKIILLFFITIVLLFLIPLLYEFYQNSTDQRFRDEDVSSLNKNKIPLVLYKTGPVEYKDLPIDIRNNFDKIIVENPDYKIEYYSDKRSIKFIKENFNQEVLDAYNGLKPGAYKADLFRYCILYKKGGVYGDLTQTYLVNLDNLVNREKDKLVLTRGGYNKNINNFRIEISFIACVKDLDIFDKCIKQIVENVKNKYYGPNCLSVTGPDLIAKIFYKNKEAQKLYKMVIKNIPYYISLNNKKVIVRKNFNSDSYLYKNIKKYGKQWYNKDIYN